jgi:hypothetical protein
VNDTFLSGPLNTSTTFYADAGSAHKPDSLMSIFESVPGNIANGNMFEISAFNKDIWIDSFGIHTQFDGGYPIWIYYKKGKYSGYENNPSAWTFLDSVFIQAKGSNKVSLVPHSGFIIPKGETYSVYISTSMVHYFNFSTGTAYFSDSNIQIYSGISLDYLFDASYAVNAVWNGKVYYSTGSYCQSPRIAAEVFVIPPADPHLPTDTAFCHGNQILLYAGPDSLYSYIWTKNHQTQTISVSNALLVDTSGIYIVRMKDPCGNTAFDTVHVQKGAIPVAGFMNQDSSQCLKDNLFVFQNQSVVSQGSLHYYWFFGDGSSSRATEPQHSYLKDSIYAVKLLAVSNLGCKDSIEKNVEVHPMPAASFVIIDSLQCLNENLFSFRNTSSIKNGSLNYTWIFDDEGSSILENPDFHFDTAGVRQITLVSYSDDLCSDSFSAFVRTVRNPEVDLGPDTVVCAHKAILLYAGSDYDAWLWPDSSTLPGLIADSNGFGLGDRLYWVRVQKNNCYGYDSVIVSFVICGSIHRTGPEMVLKIYPNPAANMLFLECEKEEAEQGLLCEILDQNGRILQQEMIYSERAGISLEYLPAALYFLRIFNKESSVIFKIIKQ